MTVLGYNRQTAAVLIQGTDFPADLESIEESGLPSPVDLDELQTYYLKFYGDVPPEFESQKHFRLLPGNVYEVNFRNYVGRSRLAGINVNVRTRKIGENQYTAILDEITEQCAGLVFSVNQSVGTQFKRERTGGNTPYLDYLFIKWFLFGRTPDLKAISNLILQDPHRRIEVEKCDQSVDRIKSFGPDSLYSVVTSPQRLMRLAPESRLKTLPLGKALQSRSGQHYFPREILQERKYFTFDTAENRFVKFFLGRLLAKLAKLSEELGPSVSFLNPDMEESLFMITSEVKAFLDDPLWQDVGEMKHLPSSSTVLRQRDGYKELFRLFSLLQLSSEYQFLDDDFSQLIESKDLPTLYEYWCFFQIKKIMDKLLGDAKKAELTHSSGSEEIVPEGLALHYRDGVILHFNLSCRRTSGTMHSSYSHTLRPDIVISVGTRKLIFDAKYKGRNGWYGEEDDGTITSPKAEDIDKMHCYREAINDVVGAFALYPGTGEERMYACPDGNSRYAAVGAFPLRPDGGECAIPPRQRRTLSDCVRTWLTEQGVCTD